MINNLKPGQPAMYVGDGEGWNLSPGDCVELIQEIPKGTEFTVNKPQILIALLDFWHVYSPSHDRRFVVQTNHLVPIDGSLNPEKQSQEEFS